MVPAQAIPPDVVTMYSQFVIRDLKLERRQTLVVCYPSDAEPAKGYISVLGIRDGASVVGCSHGAQP